MSVEWIVSWAADRDLDPVPEPGGDAVLIPYGGETGVWTARITVEAGWLVVEAMTDLEVGEDRRGPALRLASLAATVERVGQVRVDPDDGSVGTRATTHAGDEHRMAGLDAVWDASVRVTETWVPGMRDVASGIDPDAVFGRVTGLLGGRP